MLRNQLMSILNYKKYLINFLLMSLLIMHLYNDFHRHLSTFIQECMRVDRPSIFLLLVFVEQSDVILANDRDEQKYACLNEAGGQSRQLKHFTDRQAHKPYWKGYQQPQEYIMERFCECFSVYFHHVSSSILGKQTKTKASQLGQDRFVSTSNSSL